MTTVPREGTQPVREGWAPGEDLELLARRRVLAANVGELVTRGVIAGLAAGLGFLLANMGFATTQGKPAVAPLMDISTIFHGTSKPAGMTPTVDMIATGLVTHLTLSMVFGIAFAVLVIAFAKAWRSPLVLAAGGVVFGLALYVLNFQILGNTLFPWFTNPDGPHQGFEIAIHAVFGLMLVPFFLGLVPRRANK